MRRRDFITFLGATAWMSVARAGESPRRVGILGSGTKETNAPFVADFVKGLKGMGFIEGRNVTIEDRWADSTAVACCGTSRA